MTIAERVVAPVTILDLSGQLSFGDAAQDLRECVDSVLARDQTRVILNMAGLSGMDSSGLGEILRGQRLLQRQGGDLRLLGVPPNVHRTLEMTHVDSRIQTFEAEAAALASFAPSRDGPESDP